MARRKWNLETIQQVVNGENPFKQFSMTSEMSSRKEGEIWKDSKGHQWQKKNGCKVKTNSYHTPMIDEINKASKCSACGINVRVYGNRLDKKVFAKTGKCYECLQAEETILHITEKWDDYEKMKVLKNKNSILKEFKEKVLESIEFLKNDSGKISEVMSNGDLITFSGKANPQWLVDAEEDLVKVNGELEKTEKEIKKFESKLNK